MVGFRFRNSPLTQALVQSLNQSDFTLELDSSEEIALGSQFFLYQYWNSVWFRAGSAWFRILVGFGPENTDMLFGRVGFGSENSCSENLNLNPTKI